MTDKTEREYRESLAELNRVLTDRAHAATGNRIVLRDAVCAYVAVERARGTTLESVIQTVDAILTKAKEAAVGGANPTDRRDDDLARQLVAWCVDFGGTGEAVFV